MVTEFEAIQKVVRISTKEYPDEILIVYEKEDGTYDFCLECEYLGADESVRGHYINGHMTPI